MLLMPNGAQIMNPLRRAQVTAIGKGKIVISGYSDVFGTEYKQTWLCQPCEPELLVPKIPTMSLENYSNGGTSAILGTLRGDPELAETNSGSNQQT